MRLRPREEGDKGFFRELRNDPATINFSWSKRPVGDGEHERWWSATADLCFVAEVAGERVGTLRLTPMDETTCEVHIVVAPAYRGAGYAAEMLALGRQEAVRAEYKKIVARVDSPNTRSLRAFLKAGYTITSPGTFGLEREV